MSDTNETTKRPRAPLTLKKTETSTVKQSFSHGRTKAVVVEKKRTAGAPAAKSIVAPEKTAKAPAPAAPVETKPAAPQRDSRSGVVLRQLTEEEKVARS